MNNTVAIIIVISQQCVFNDRDLYIELTIGRGNRKSLAYSEFLLGSAGLVFIITSPKVLMQAGPIFTYLKRDSSPKNQKQTSFSPSSLQCYLSIQTVVGFWRFQLQRSIIELDDPFLVVRQNNMVEKHLNDCQLVAVSHVCFGIFSLNWSLKLCILI